MNRSATDRSLLRKWIFATALVYGGSIGFFVVPRVVGAVVPEVLRSISTNARSMNQNSKECPCRFLAKSRAITARLWNDFQ